MRLPPGAQVASLKRMAAEHLREDEARGRAGGGFQAGGSKHCAVEDAWVTLRIYSALEGGEKGGEM